MRVLALSATTLFPTQVIGGSQRILAEILPTLSAEVDQVKVLCPAAEENQKDFKIGQAQVIPQLHLTSFPTPWRIPPGKLRCTINAIKTAAEWADRIYIHGDALYPRSALCNKPIVRSFHDFFYQEALLSAFAERADLTITPSEYLKNCITATACPNEPIMVIPNGVSVGPFPPIPTDIGGIAPRVPNEIILLLPHRADPDKGLAEALNIANQVKKTARRPVRLLAARFESRLNRDRLNNEYGDMVGTALKVAPEVMFETYTWLPYGKMPNLYAFADVVLCPGRFVEAFGLVPLEAVAAGTPAIVAKVGALRAFDEVPNLHAFPYGNHSQAADLVLHALDNPRIAEGREFVKENFSLQKMANGYADAITGGLEKPVHPKVRSEENGDLLPAPWVFAEGTRIWDDYASCWREDLPHLAKFIEGARHDRRTSMESAVPSCEISLAKRDFIVVSQY